ncbi:MAG: segregation and condensation protein, partial [Bacteroidota bacterium]|nr:segregation and condensation protein [Bacteroidota bacterium]
KVLIFTSEEPLTIDMLLKILIFSEYPEEQVEASLDDDSQLPLKRQNSINKEIASSLNLNDNFFKDIIDEINRELMDTGRPFQIINNAGGYLYAARSEYGELIRHLSKSKAQRRLSQASLEALAIIAYRQPVSKPEIELIRGVNSNEVVNTLIEKGLIKIAGRRDALGKPLLYATTNDFLKTFGLNSLEELPKLRELEEIADMDSDFTPERKNYTLTVKPEEVIITKYESEI